MPVYPYINLCGDRWSTWKIIYKRRSSRILEKPPKILKISSYSLYCITWTSRSMKTITETVNSILSNAKTHNNFKKCILKTNLITLLSTVLWGGYQAPKTYTLYVSWSIRTYPLKKGWSPIHNWKMTNTGSAAFSSTSRNTYKLSPWHCTEL
jgi:hypothetical protein